MRNFEDPSFLPIGSQLSLKYKVIGHVGAGGCGKTYLVSNVLGFGGNLVVKEFYVSKMCSRDVTTKKVTVSVENRESFEHMRERFKKEAIKVSQLTHPHIVKVIDLFEANDTVYYVMNEVRGESLADKINRGEIFTERRVMRYLGQLLDALEYIHSRKPVGIMHLDIKPANIMIDENDNVVLIDFGASKSFNSTSVNQTLMSTVGLLYTAGYAPIEQENGNVEDLGPHCDIYALGATLFKIFTGQTPPKPYDIRKKGLPPITGASPLMQKIIRKALEFDYDRRIKSVAEFRAMLVSGSNVEDTEYDYDAERVNDSDNVNRQSRAEAPTKTHPQQKTAPPAKPKPPKVSTPEPNPTPNPGLKIIAGVVALILLVASGYVAFGGFSGDKGADPVEVKEVDNANIESRTVTVNGVSFDMVKVEGGTFTMGATSEQIGDADSDESPVHQVTLSDYYIGKYEVTQGLWEAVMRYSGTCADGSSMSAYSSDVWLGSDPTSGCGLGSDYPAYYVSWEDIVNVFIPRLNKITGKTFRLPTEAEWEFAARGGNNSRGCKYSGGNTIGDVAWYSGNASSTTHPVGTKSPNELGLYDMSGNVWEWCSDWYGSYPSSSQTNPTGPSSGSSRVSRGGSWSSTARDCRVSFRFYSNPEFRYYYLGFRLACGL